MYFAVALLGICMNNVDAGKCQPVRMVLTRATADSAHFKNGKWFTDYDVESVNMASLAGALKYVFSETVEELAYDGNCLRKNNASFIQMYDSYICNPDAALWWYNRDRPLQYGNDHRQFDLGEFGVFHTMDRGKCHGSRRCDYLSGINDAPKLGPYVGVQPEFDDRRCPTDEAYWFSLPGACMQNEWGSKNKTCIQQAPSGKCPPGVLPDGMTCTWSATLLGQVKLDDLVGITNIAKNKTHHYTSAQEYCKDGHFEFQRSRTTKEFVSGLDFWKDPTSRVANAERIQKLIQHYQKQPNNFPLPSTEQLQKSNPPCYQTNPNCFISNREICFRNAQMICQRCTSPSCEKNLNIVDPPKVLQPVQLPKNNNNRRPMLN